MRSVGQLQQPRLKQELVLQFMIRSQHKTLAVHREDEIPTETFCERTVPMEAMFAINMTVCTGWPQ
jgi:hypothetical protein